MPQNNSYDVIVVGGGSSGCVAAARLSEDGHRRVLLLEAGPDPSPIPDAIADGSHGTVPLFESPFLETYPTSRPNGSTYDLLSGRIMGGGSSVNAMVMVRPTKHDLDTWAGRGNPGWSYEECLPVLKRIETYHGRGDNEIHGNAGPTHIEQSSPLDARVSGFMAAFIQRVLQMGLPFSAEESVPDPVGVMPVAANIREGLRQSTTVSYLDAARERPNLRVVADATVLSLKVNGSRAHGVRYERFGEPHSASARRVVVCAGVYHSPQLLMLSGIGPSGDLERLGIEVMHSVPGVGHNYQDHAAVTMMFDRSSQERAVLPIAGLVRVVFKSDAGLPNADIDVYLRPAIERQGSSSALPIMVNILSHQARGRVYLNSADPRQLPGIDNALLTHPADIRAMTTGMEFVHELVQGDSMEPYYGSLLQPSPDEDWERYARATYDSYQHGAGTCMMGPASDPMAVVDGELRVHGIHGLYIGDASVMPTIPHANTNMAALMIGERVSEFVVAAGG